MRKSSRGFILRISLGLIRTSSVSRMAILPPREMIGRKPFLFAQMLGDVIGGAGIRHPHEQLGVAVVEDGVGPILAHLGIQLADRLAVAVDEHPGPAGLGKEVLDPLVEHRLGLVDMEHQRGRHIPALE
jgi:hypothetical protein